MTGVTSIWVFNLTYWGIRALGVFGAWGLEQYFGLNAAGGFFLYLGGFFAAPYVLTPTLFKMMPLSAPSLNRVSWFLVGEVAVLFALMVGTFSIIGMFGPYGLQMRWMSIALMVIATIATILAIESVLIFGSSFDERPDAIWSYDYFVPHDSERAGARSLRLIAAISGIGILAIPLLYLKGVRWNSATHTTP